MTYLIVGIIWLVLAGIGVIYWWLVIKEKNIHRTVEEFNKLLVNSTLTPYGVETVIRSLIAMHLPKYHLQKNPWKAKVWKNP